ncbi:GNAT family N-acetyltransferase [Caminibacter sp.]
MRKNYKIKNFTKLSFFEKLQIYYWRKDRRVAKFMNTNDFTFKDHLGFIDFLKFSKNRYYYKVGDLGTIYFTLKGDFVEIGLYKNPDKKKVGKILMEHIFTVYKSRFKDKKMVLYVYKFNTKAVNLYKKFGFKVTDRKKNIIKMIKKGFK